MQKTLPNHNSLIDYCLQQRSGRRQSEEHRAKITVPTTNRQKAKLTITNSKLTPHKHGFHLEKQRLQTDKAKR